MRPLVATPPVPGPIGGPANGVARGGAADDDGMSFVVVREALRRGVWIILGTCALVVTLVGGYTLLLPREYDSSALVFVDVGGEPAAEVSVPGAAQPVRSLSNELGRLQYSQDLRVRVARRLMEASEVVGNAAYFPVLQPQDGSDTVTVADVSARLYERVRFDALGAQSMVAIRVTSTVPEEAARIANFYAEEYEAVALEESRAGVVAARTFLEGQVEKLGEELNEIDNRMVSFSQSRGLPQQGADGQLLVGRFAGYQAQRDEVRLQLEQERHALEVIEEELARVDPGTPGAARPPSTAGLEAEVASYQQRVAELRLRAEEFYVNDPSLRGNEGSVPELQEIVNQVAHYEARREQLEDRLAELLQAHPTQDGTYAAQLQAQRIERQSTVRGLEAQLGALGGQIDLLGRQVQGIPRQNVELAQLERRRGVLISWYSQFLEDLQRVLVAEEAELGYVRIVSTASVPYMPVRPNLKQNLVLAVLLGLGFGVGLAFVRYASGQQLKGPEDVEEQGFRVLGVIPPLDPQIRKRYKGKDSVAVDAGRLSTKLPTALEPWSPVTENFRLMRTNLEQLQAGAPGVLLVTSSEMGAGKTLTATNLAVAMATGGRRTLLIDADLRRPSTHKLISGAAGADGATLAGLLEAGPAWAGLLAGSDLSTSVQGLDLLPAGRPTVPPSELLRDEVLGALLDHVRGAYDAVVIDSPPVLVATDVLLLAQHVDAAVVVVSANGTDTRAFEHTLAALGGVGAVVAGIVVNRFGGEGRTGYAYGYAYDYAQAYHTRP